MKCPKCEYEWEYKGKSQYWICCPRCKHQQKVNNNNPTANPQKSGEAGVNKKWKIKIHQ